MRIKVKNNKYIVQKKIFHLNFRLLSFYYENATYKIKSPREKLQSKILNGLKTITLAKTCTIMLS